MPTQNLLRLLLLLMLRIVLATVCCRFWELRFGHKAELLFRLRAQGLVKILRLNFRQDLEAGIVYKFNTLELDYYVEGHSLELGT